MADSAETEEVFWVDPKSRGVIPLEDFHAPRSLRKRIRRGDFEVTVDGAFLDVVDACADRAETWINGEIRRLYIALHRMGYAHSIEVWMEGRLAGGLYGVRLGGAFFGESMFHRRPDASKIALVWLVARLRAGGFSLLDAQFTTDHLERFGARSVARDEYHRRLDRALRRSADFFALDEGVCSQRVLQLISQTS